MTTQVRAPRAEAARLPAFVTGLGLGAFVDGIVLHQLLQWHHLVVARVPVDDVGSLQRNVVWDGVFHAAAWAVVLAGLLWLSHRGDDARALGPRRTSGLLVAGWGVFNLLDEAVFHLLLDSHTVRTGSDPVVYETGWTLLGVLLVAAGLLLARDRG